MMQDVYKKVQTPFKYGLVMMAPGPYQKIDGPGIFRRGDAWFMVYTIYDRTGQETWLAQSSDLLTWRVKSKVLTSLADSSWDGTHKAGTVALQDLTWDGTYQWEKYNNRYWLSYAGGNTRSTETATYSAGIAYSYQDPSINHPWIRVDKPVLTPSDAGTLKAENNSIYRGFVLRDNQQFTGHPFLMYYNAKGDSLSAGGSGNIGLAVSDDMVRWQRYGNEPVIVHNAGMAGNPSIVKIDNLYVMFYNSIKPEDDKGARSASRFACSYDLINWTDWKGQPLIKPSEVYDNLYTRNSTIIHYKGVVYHFYCALNNKDQQGIAVATSVDLGKSKMAFVPTGF
ncbi:MAG: glycosylase [Williamsia sp.]|nr:glycosylase [Williamsia sp.]